MQNLGTKIASSTPFMNKINLLAICFHCHLGYDEQETDQDKCRREINWWKYSRTCTRKKERNRHVHSSANPWFSLADAVLWQSLITAKGGGALLPSMDTGNLAKQRKSCVFLWFILLSYILLLDCAWMCMSISLWPEDVQSRIGCRNP